MFHPPLNPRILTAQLTAAFVEFRRIADDATGPDLDVRVVADIGDSHWWLSAGDVQYDTVHGDICAAGTMWVSMDSSEIRELAVQLCDEIDSLLADFEAADSEVA
jgi:hypothetical protein